MYFDQVYNIFALLAVGLIGITFGQRYEQNLHTIAPYPNIDPDG